MQVPVMSLAQKVVVSEPGYEPKLEGRSEQGADLYKAMLEDTGQPIFNHHGETLSFRSCISDAMVAVSACLVQCHHTPVYRYSRRAYLGVMHNICNRCHDMCVVAVGGEYSWEFKDSPLKKEKVFDMAHVWTFHIHQHMVDMSTFTLYVLRHFDITHYLNGQPLQSMIKDRWAQPCQSQC